MFCKTGNGRQYRVFLYDIASIGQSHVYGKENLLLDYFYVLIDDLCDYGKMAWSGEMLLHSACGNRHEEGI